MLAFVHVPQESISKLLRCTIDSVQTLFGISPSVTRTSSDRSNAIRNGVKKIYPAATKVLCWVHILRDVRGPDIGQPMVDVLSRPVKSFLLPLTGHFSFRWISP